MRRELHWRRRLHGSIQWRIYGGGIEPCPLGKILFPTMGKNKETWSGPLVWALEAIHGHVRKLNKEMVVTWLTSCKSGPHRYSCRWIVYDAVYEELCCCAERTTGRWPLIVDLTVLQLHQPGWSSLQDKGVQTRAGTGKPAHVQSITESWTLFFIACVVYNPIQSHFQARHITQKKVKITRYMTYHSANSSSQSILLYFIHLFGINE